MNEKKRHRPPLKFDWSDYKSRHGSEHVNFGGGLAVYATRETDAFKLTDRWRVMWYDGGNGKNAVSIPGLSPRRWYATRDAAKRAAEAVLMPLLLLSPHLLGVSVTTELHSGRALRLPLKRKAQP